MAKKNLTQATYAVDNVQQLPVQVKGQASLVQQTFDKASLDQKTYNNDTLLVELADETANNSGSNTIGHNSTSITADNVGDSLEENRLKIDTNETNISNLDTGKANDNEVVKLTGSQTIAGVKTFSSLPTIPETPLVNTDASSKGYVDTEIAGVVLGQIPDNSLTNAKLGTDVKVGSLALLNTTDKSDVTSAINEVNQSVTNRDTATDGQVLFSNGDGTSTYENPSVNGKLLADITVPANTSQLDIENIGLENYDQIVIKMLGIRCVTNTSAGDLYLRFNDDTGNNYYSTTSALSYGRLNNIMARLFDTTFGDVVISNVISASSDKQKSVYTHFVSPTSIYGGSDSSGAYNTSACSWKNFVDKITKISLFASNSTTINDQIAQNSRLQVWGYN